MLSFLLTLNVFKIPKVRSSFIYILLLFLCFSCEEGDNNAQEIKVNDSSKVVNSDTDSVRPEIEYISLDAISTFNDWDKIETEFNPKIIDGIIVELTEQHSPYLFDEGATIDSVKRNYHFVHLNGDTLVDLIFVGWSGGETKKTEVYLQTSLYQFDLIGRYFQEPYKIKIKDKKLEQLLIIDNGCCGTPYGKLLTLNFNGNNLEVKHDSVFPFYTSKLGVKLKLPITLTFDEPKVLRSGPEEDDSSDMGPYGKIGNQLGTLAPGVVLTGIENHQDYKGLMWYKVITEPTNKIDRKLFQDSDTIPSKYVGWVLKKI